MRKIEKNDNTKKWQNEIKGKEINKYTWRNNNNNNNRNERKTKKK